MTRTRTGRTSCLGSVDAEVAQNSTGGCVRELRASLVVLCHRRWCLRVPQPARGREWPLHGLSFGVPREKEKKMVIYAIQEEMQNIICRLGVPSPVSGLSACRADVCAARPLARRMGAPPCARRVLCLFKFQFPHPAWPHSSPISSISTALMQAPDGGAGEGGGGGKGAAEREQEGVGLKCSAEKSAEKGGDFADEATGGALKLLSGGQLGTDGQERGRASKAGGREGGGRVAPYFLNKGEQHKISMDIWLPASGMTLLEEEEMPEFVHRSSSTVSKEN